MQALGLTQQLSSYIIRPPRAAYSLADLGQTIFEYKGIIYQRIDFTVPPSQNNLKLQASIYLDKANQNKIRPTLIYLHANSSSRVSAKNYLKNVIQYFDVVCFDFRGCGMSEGNYLTLGYLQKYDVKAIVSQVDKKFGNRRYLIWGRSMGAVTAILYIAKFIKNSDKVYGLVLDSPFADLQKVIYFLGDKKLPLVPRFMIQSVIQSLEDYAKQKIKKQYNKNFLIRKHKPIQQISLIRIPIFFIGSKSDELVDCKQIQQMYDNAFCHKQLELLEGGHNQIRPQHLKLAVVEFLLASLTMKKQNISRKKIFDYVGLDKSSPFLQSNQKNLSQTQKKITQNNTQELPNKSKSKQKNRVFRIQSNNKSPDKSHMKKSQNMKVRQSINNQAKNETEITHMQILNKVLPQNSIRRTNRIFTNMKPKQQ